MAVLVGVDLAEVDARGPQLGLGHPGATGGHVEHLDHGGPLCAPILARVSGDRLGRDPAPSVRRAGQHREGGLAGQEVLGLDGVAGSQDVGCRGAHVGVDRDAATWSDLDAGRTSQLDVRTRACGHDQDVGLERRAVGEVDHQPVVCAAANCVRRGAQPEVHVVRGHVVVQDPGELGVEPRHQPVGPLDHGGLQPPRPEGLRELQSDVAAADHDGARGAKVETGDDVVHVGDVPQHVNPRVVRARDRRSNRFRPGAQHELVVGLAVGAPPLLVTHLDLFGVPVDADDFLPGAHVEGEALAQAFRCLQQQAVSLRDLPADVVGQAAVRERDVVIALEDDDLGRLVQPPQPCSRRGTRRNSTHDHRLHLVASPVPSSTDLFRWSASQRGHASPFTDDAVPQPGPIGLKSALLRQSWATPLRTGIQRRHGRGSVGAGRSGIRHRGAALGEPP